MSSEIQQAQPRPRFMTAMFGRNPTWTLVRILLLGLTVYLLLKFVFIPIRIDGVNMAPNLRDRWPNLVNKLAYRKATPKRGDVVAIQMPGENSLLLIRIVGLPGEKITVNEGEVSIDGKKLDEKYVKLKRDPSWNHEDVVPPDHYFFMGDNRSMPFDENYCLLAERQRIVGRVVF